MLRKIKIAGFKSIEDMGEGIELGRVNVFIGANGSGKSNFLEAVGLLSAAISSGNIDERLREKGVRQSPEQLYKTSLAMSSGRTGPIRLNAVYEPDPGVVDIRFVLNPPSTQNSIWSYESGKLLSDENIALEVRGEPGSEDTFGTFAIQLVKIISKSLNLSNTTEYRIYEPSTAILRGIMPDFYQGVPTGLGGGRLAEALGELLDVENGKFGSLDIDEVFELLDWVKEFDITSPTKELLSANVPSLRQVVRFTDRFMGKNRNQLTGYDASEGALYVLFMLALALHANSPNFFAVENFDHALNPRLARRLMRVFADLIINSESDKQVLLTTHNPLVIDGLDLNNDEIRLFVVERNKRGGTQFRRILVSPEILKDVDSGMTLSRLWVMGRLGGVPDL